MTFKEVLIKAIAPYENNVTKGNSSSFSIHNLIDLVEEIRTEDFADTYTVDEIKSIDKTVYEWCYNGPLSKTYVGMDGELNFILNGETLDKFDVEVKFIANHFYIFSKVQIVIDSLIIVSGNEQIIIHGMTTDVVDPTSDPDVLHIKVNQYFGVIYDNTKGLEVTIKKKNVPISTDGIDKRIFFDTTKIVKDVLIIDENGIHLDIQNYLIIKPFYVEMISTIPNTVKCFVFYEDNPYKSDNDYTENYYLEKLFDNLTESEMETIDIKYEDIKLDVESFDSDFDLTDYLINFNYDLHMWIQKYNHTFNFVFDQRLNTKFQIRDTTKSHTPFSEVAEFEESPFYVTFTFRNYYNNLFELYVDRKLYHGFFLMDQSDYETTIYIATEDLVNYTDDYENSTYMVLLKPKTYKRIDYLAPTKDYNGVAFLSRDYTEFYNPEFYDNGINLVYGDDFEINNIPPINFMAIFPRLRVGWHRISMTAFTEDFKRSDVTKKKSDIVNNILEVNYIDYRFFIRCGNYTLIPYIDYEILSPTKIYIKNMTINTIPSDDTELRIIFEGSVDKYLLDLSVKSLTKKLYDNEMLTTTYYTNITSGTINEINNKPPRYSDDVYYRHMMTTKYFNSELVVDCNETTKYGTDWNNNLMAEFPQFVNPDGRIQINLATPVAIDELPRIIEIPAKLPLNVIMAEHELAITRMKFENIFISKYHGTLDATLYYNSIIKDYKYKWLTRYANSAFSTIAINYLKQ